MEGVDCFLLADMTTLPLTQVVAGHVTSYPQGHNPNFYHELSKRGTPEGIIRQTTVDDSSESSAPEGVGIFHKKISRLGTRSCAQVIQQDACHVNTDKSDLQNAKTRTKALISPLKFPPPLLLKGLSPHTRSTRGFRNGGGFLKLGWEDFPKPSEIGQTQNEFQ